MRKDNNVVIDGMVINNLQFDHMVGKLKHYRFSIVCRRLSGTYDEIPVIVSKKIKEKLSIKKGDFIRVVGRMQSYNSQSAENYGKRLVFVYASDIQSADKKSSKNEVTLKAEICKQPHYRITLRGKRITDIVLKHYGTYPYYIPAVFWNDMATKVSKYDIGTKLCIKARFQSRDYIKPISDIKTEMHRTYELSVCDMKIL